MDRVHRKGATVQGSYNRDPEDYEQLGEFEIVDQWIVRPRGRPWPATLGLLKP